MEEKSPGSDTGVGRDDSHMGGYKSSSIRPIKADEKEKSKVRQKRQEERTDMRIILKSFLPDKPQKDYIGSLTC
jgi:hypothetical protein